MKAKVYFTNMNIKNGESLPAKLEKLVKAAGIENIDFKEKFTAIKIHFGEPGNMAYLRSNYAKRIVDIVKRMGGLPFLTDCNTLYVGRRKNALDHIEAAYENGYSPFQTGCHVIIADGLKGTDEANIIIDQEYVKEAKIGQAIADSDIIISMNHFKGHGLAGFGGALKNIGMGCGSRAGKHEMHSTGIPYITQKNCVSCRKCVKNCAQGAIKIDEFNKAVLSKELCLGCGRCIGVCNYNAIKTDWSESSVNMNKKVAEYTYAVLKDKPSFHINFIIDVSPSCDCEGTNDVPIIANIGFLASFDIVALDMASVDLVNKAPLINEYVSKHKDHFHSIYPNTSWEAGLEHAEKIGLGKREYELIEI